MDDRGTSTQFHLGFARVCIEVGLEDEVVSEVSVEVDGGQVVDIEVILPWSPERCTECKTFGHHCLKKHANPAKEGRAPETTHAVNESHAIAKPQKMKDKDTLVEAQPSKM